MRCTIRAEDIDTTWQSMLPVWLGQSLQFSRAGVDVAPSASRQMLQQRLVAGGLEQLPSRAMGQSSIISLTKSRSIRSASRG